MKYPPVLQAVIDQLASWPTVGPKTAERFVFYLLKQKPETIRELAEGLMSLQSKLTHCRICQTIAVDDPCAICRDASRDRTLLCVVAESRDMLAIEETGQFKGIFHVLGGTISAINNADREALALNQLLARLKNENIKEIILAFNPDIEGETTALYLTRIMAGINIKITRLARGLPAGASLDYADPMTLSHALNFRR